MGIFERTLPTIYETSSSTEKRITHNKNNNPKIFFLSTIVIELKNHWNISIF